MVFFNIEATIKTINCDEDVLRPSVVVEDKIFLGAVNLLKKCLNPKAELTYVYVNTFGYANGKFYLLSSHIFNEAQFYDMVYETTGRNF